MTGKREAAVRAPSKEKAASIARLGAVIYSAEAHETRGEDRDRFASFLKGGENRQMFALRSETVRMRCSVL